MDGTSRTAMEAGSFRGLFYGVGDYPHRGIPRLRYAHRDAEAMYEVFGGDSGDNRLAIDEDVTKDKIESDLNDLRMSSGPDDRVLVYFSGHGAPSAHLVTFDAEPANLAATAIGLGELRAAMFEIPAKSVIVALDCCFAGSDPDDAKVLRMPLNARGGAPAEPAEHYLEHIHRGGRGRVLITASSADERAWENDHYKHGVFTYHLIKALVSEPETATGGEISLNRVWAYLSERVSKEVSLYGHRRQLPTKYGTLAPDILLPRTKPTARLLELWREKMLPQPVDSHPASLLEHGVSAEVIEAWSAGGIKELKPLQVDAVNDRGVMAGSRLVVDAPTSSGKTLIGELAALRAVADGERAVFLLPSRALVAEQYRRYTDVYGHAKLRVVRAVGSVDDQVADLVTGRYDLAVLTYEKFAALLLRRPGLLDGVGTVVVDELHNIVDPERGAGLELLLTRLLSAARDLPVQIVGLSAVLGEGHLLDTWLDAGLHRSTERPIPLQLAVLSHDGKYRFLDDFRYEYEDDQYLAQAEDADAITLDFIRRAVDDGEKVLVFSGSRYSVMQQARRLAEAMGYAAAEEALAALGTDDSGRVVDHLKRCLRHGVAFHTAALTEHQRGVLEESFRKRDEIKVIVSTTTLAQGVNLPVDTVVIRDFEQGNRRTGRYSVARFRDIAGRAGRTGLVSGRGRAVIIAQDEMDAQRKWDGFVLARPEKLRSALAAPDRRLDDIVLSACANIPVTGAGRISTARVVGFLNHTWAAHQAYWSFARDPFEQREIDSAIDHLEAFGLLDRRGPDIMLTSLGSIAVFDHLRSDSARTIADVLEKVGFGGLNASTIIAIVQLTVELDAIEFSGLYGNGDARRVAEDYRRILAKHHVAHPVLERMFSGGDAQLDLSRARRTVACLQWASGSPVSTVEKAISTFIPSLPDQDPGPIFRVTERTADFIGAAIRIADLVCPAVGDRATSAAWLEVARTLQARVELGLKSGLAEIALHVRPQLPRDVYLKLARASLCDKQAILEAGVADVQACLGTADGSAELLIAAAQRTLEMACERAWMDTLPTFE